MTCSDISTDTKTVKTDRKGEEDKDIYMLYQEGWFAKTPKQDLFSKRTQTRTDTDTTHGHHNLETESAMWADFFFFFQGWIS